MTEQGIGYLRSEAWAQIVPGFVSKAAVVEGMRELAEDDVALGVSATQAEDLVDGLWAERLACLAGPSIRTPTDDVRIADAFDRLGEEGIVARMNCGFDQSEGEALCRDEAQGRGSHGFVFFHSQDAGRLVDAEAVLYLGFDAVPTYGERFTSKQAYDEAASAVGHQIVEALRARGLTVEWDGTPNRRPAITGLDWRRPLHDD